MIRVGLTGGIGSGKSTVAQYFRDLGIPVYEADTAAKRLMNTEVTLVQQIKDLLGEGAYSPEGLNRSYIAEKVFGNSNLLAQLNALVHPVVRQDFNTWAASQQAPYVLQEAAILFETGGHDHFDYNILVTAPEETRIRRVMKRDGTSRKQVEARLSNQWKDDRKIPLADFVLDNRDRRKTRTNVRRIHRKLLELSGPPGRPLC